MSEKFVLTPMEAAEMLGVGRNKIYELLRSDSFPVLNIGRLKRVPRQELQEWITQNCNKGDN